MESTCKVGIEVEYFLLNPKGEPVIIPNHWDRDAFTVLGEVRGEPGNNVANAIGNYYQKFYEILGNCKEGWTMSMEAMRQIPLALYKKAMQDMNAADKENHYTGIHNIYGTNISDFSDQILKGSKIQGARASCGMHIHFSCGVSDQRTITEEQYEACTLPVVIPTMVGTDRVLRENFNIELWKKMGYKEKETIRVEVSLLTKPVVEWIVKSMDEQFFNRFAPPKDKCTKYRQAGFYELKPYGFEYRSLPATMESIAALPEIVGHAFELLKTVRLATW